MKVKPRLRTVLVVIAAVSGAIGLFLVALSAWYGGCYLFDSPTNPYRSEYLEGAAMALSQASPLWLVFSAAVFPLRSEMSRTKYLLANVPTALLGLATLGFLLFVLAQVVLSIHAA
jgi:hypothetical protein